MRREHAVKVSIMQPGYLPWCGLFSLIDRSDVHILLDTVQYERHGWDNRNRIRGRDGNVVWLTVPVHGRRAPLNEVEIVAEIEWQTKHWRTISHAYGKTPGWDMLVGWASAPLDRDWRYLVDLTADLTGRLSRSLGIDTPIVRASALGNTRAGKVERIIDLCRSVGADTLLDTRGATFLDESLLEGIHLEWHDYEPVPYAQGGMEWQSHLSVLDCLAWCGDDALSVVRAGYHSEP